MSGWAKKNQCHQDVANRASVRARCSLIGMQSSRASRGHAVGVVQGQPERDVAAPVVAGQGEPRVTEVVHQPDEVTRHGPLAVGGMVGGGRRADGLPVAAQIGADDAEALRHEPGRHPVPGGDVLG